MNSNESHTVELGSVTELRDVFQKREQSIQEELSEWIEDRSRYTDSCLTVDGLARRHSHRPRGLLLALRREPHRQLAAHVHDCPYCLVRVLCTLGLWDVVNYSVVLEQIQRRAMDGEASRAPSYAREGATAPAVWSMEVVEDLLAGIKNYNEDAEQRLQQLIVARFAAVVQLCLGVLGRPRPDTISRALARPYYELLVRTRHLRPGPSPIGFQKTFLNMLVRYMEAATPVVSQQELEGEVARPACQELRAMLADESSLLPPACRGHLTRCRECWRWWQCQVKQRAEGSLEQETRDPGLSAFLRVAVSRLTESAARVNQSLLDHWHTLTTVVSPQSVSSRELNCYASSSPFNPADTHYQYEKQGVMDNRAKVSIIAKSAGQQADGRFYVMVLSEDRPELLKGKGALLVHEGIPVGFGRFTLIGGSMQARLMLKPEAEEVNPRILDPGDFLEPFDIQIIDAP